MLQISMLRDELNRILDRVLTWPSAAQEKLMIAIHEIEAGHGLDYSGFNREQARSSVLESETETFLKRHPFWF